MEQNATGENKEVDSNLNSRPYLDSVALTGYDSLRDFLFQVSFRHRRLPKSVESRPLWLTRWRLRRNANGLQPVKILGLRAVKPRRVDKEGDVTDRRTSAALFNLLKHMFGE